MNLIQTNSGRRVAVIGGGPAGLTAAKHLLEEGLEPIVFERGKDLGGHWHTAGAHSAVWPGMRTNTSRTTTAFSGFPPAPTLAMFPRAEDVHAYLREYATHFGVLDRILTGTRVLDVTHTSGGGYSVRWSSGQTEHEDRFAGVIVASGRFQRPRLPDLPGIEDLAAQRRLRHSMAYRGRDEFRGRRVLVLGNSISGVEIASDLAAEHTIGVISAARKPRYVIQKIVRGQPTDWRWFNRFSALLANALPPEELAAGMREAVLAEAGDPVRFGGLVVDPRVPPKLSQSQEYLAQVAEGRIAVRPAVTSLGAGKARFADGSRSDVDEVICATGYELDLDYLAPGIRRLVQASQTQLNLHARTFHPELPGLGFLGQFQLIGPHFPIFELQARWIAGVWSGSLPAPSTERMYAGVAEHQATRDMAPIDMYPALAALLAGELGVEPDLAARPELAEGLLFGPLAPARYRLDGPGSRPEAEALFRAALADFGPPVPTAPQQVEALRMVAAALEDPVLADVAERLDAGVATMKT